MNRTAAHWWGLVAGVVVLQVVLLGLDRLPGLSEPVVVENRSLASVPALPRSVRDLERFRLELDSYVADHFPPRQYLIAGLNYLRYLSGFSGTRRVFVGEQGWLFYDNDSHFSQLRPSTLTPPEATAWVEMLRSRSEFLANRGIPYLVVSAPVKERLYPDRLPDWLGNGGPSADADVLGAAAARVGVKAYVDLRPPLMQARANGVEIYSAFDTHWTGEGAYHAYVAIIEAMNAKGLPVRPHPRSHFSADRVARAQMPQDLAHMLGIASLVRQSYAQLVQSVPAPSPKIQYLGVGADWTADRVVDTGARGPVLMLTGDSFSTALLPLLNASFSRIVFSHHQNGFFREDLIDRFKPDLVLLEVIESGVRHTMQPPLVGDSPNGDKR